MTIVNNPWSPPRVTHVRRSADSTPDFDRIAHCQSPSCSSFINSCSSDRRTGSCCLKCDRTLAGAWSPQRISTFTDRARYLLSPATFATQMSLCKSLRVKYSQPPYSAIPFEALL